MTAALEIKRDEKKGKIWSHVRSKWLVETPEETVRQEYRKRPADPSVKLGQFMQMV